MQPTKVEKRKSNKGKMGCGFLIIFFLILAGLIVAGAYFMKERYDSTLNEPLSENAESITFEITEGESVDQIIDSLISADIITSNQSKYLQIYLRLNELGSTLQAGSFSIPKDLTMVELVETLQSAGIPEVWVTIPEGLRYDEIADIIEEEMADQEGSDFNKDTFIQLVKDPDFVNSLGLNGNSQTLEGFLFPDKYLIPVETTEEDIIKILIENFNNKVSGEYTYEDIILASMLEREGRTNEERKMIADIINRRLEEGWFLNIDATILYYYQDWEREITQDDLDTDQPYNTYTRIGLPPTPISNPGLGSIEAALTPTPNQYYYYLHDPDGIIHYAENFEEHSANISNYLR